MPNWVTDKSWDFSSAADWTLGTGWEITGGKLVGALQNSCQLAYVTDYTASGITPRLRKRFTFTLTTHNDPTNCCGGRIRVRSWGESPPDLAVVQLRFLEGVSPVIRMYHTDMTLSNYVDLQAWAASTAYTVTIDVDLISSKIMSVTINGTEYNNSGNGWPTRGPKAFLIDLYFDSLSSTTGKSITIDNVTVEKDTLSNVVATSLAYPGTVYEETGSGGCAWANTANIKAMDGNKASITSSSFDAGVYVNRLYLYNFGLSIPTNAKIVGVWGQMLLGYSSAGCTTDLTVIRVLDTSRAYGDNDPTYLTGLLSAVDESALKLDFGCVGELFGEALTPAWVNDSDFGILIQPKANSANTDFYIDAVRIAVMYQLTGLQTLRGGMW